MVAIEDRVPSASEEEASRLRLILEATPNAMVMVGADGRIVLVNAQAEALFGFDRSALLSMRVEELIPRRSRGAHLRYRASLPGRVRGAPHGRGPGPVRAAQRRHRGTDRDRPEPDRHRRGEVRAGLGHRHQRAVGSPGRPRGGGQGLAAPQHPGEHDLQRPRHGPGGSDRRGEPRHRAAARVPGDGTPGPLADQTSTAPRTLPGTTGRGAPTARSASLAYRRRDGSEVTVGEAITPVVDEDGTATGYLAVAFDITKRLEVRARVAYLADHDALTGLPNRSMLTQHLVQAITSAERERSKVALLLLDVDHFKRVNDSLGHHAGDRLLLRVAEQTRAGERRGRPGRPARRGRVRDGLLGDLRRPGGARQDQGDRGAAADLGHGQQPRGARDRQRRVRGLPRPRGDPFPPAQERRHRDVPGEGRGAQQRAVVPAGDARGQQREVWCSPRHCDMRWRGTTSLSVVYQPQVCFESGEVVAYEALARWRSPSVGQVPPDRFIPVAEDSGLITALGGWVLRRACQDAAAIRAASGLPLRVAVNVSPRQFARKTWLSEVRAALDAADLPASALEPGDHRGNLDERRPRRARRAARPEADRRPDRGRRLRPGVLQPCVPDPLPRRQDQDRPRVRPTALHHRRGRGGHRRHPRDGPRPGHVGRGRGRRDDRAGEPTSAPRAATRVRASTTEGACRWRPSWPASPPQPGASVTSATVASSATSRA
ncbi:EAL domain-containing protein [Nocardioides convexus]|uniref:EAL domain-containing protein n=1 Tax=Nocardioides convexus TaxID=2712224 RepID=UPI0024189D24|nr:EAL domain-containing protein [Nocardioides convexus]